MDITGVQPNFPITIGKMLNFDGQGGTDVTCKQTFSVATVNINGLLNMDVIIKYLIRHFQCFFVLFKIVFGIGLVLQHVYGLSKSVHVLFAIRIQTHVVILQSLQIKYFLNCLPVSPQVLSAKILQCSRYGWEENNAFLILGEAAINFQKQYNMMWNIGSVKYKVFFFG